MDGRILGQDNTEGKSISLMIDSLFTLMQTLARMVEIGQISKNMHEQIVSLSRASLDKIASVCYHSRANRLHQYKQYG